MRVLVTGAAGFVGQHLIPRLEADGHDVVATDQDLDVTDPERLRQRVGEIAPGGVVHLAALSNPTASWDAPEQTYRVNFVGTRNLLEAIGARAPDARIILVGSSVQYGSAQPGSPPFDETSPQRPASPYARSKTAADLLGAAYAERGVDVVRARPFNHSGRGQLDQYVLSSFARQVAEIASGRAEPLLRVGNLDSVRDFLDVEDVVEAYTRLLDRDAPGGAYNVARGVGYPIRELLGQLIELAGIDPSVEVDPERMRPMDVSVGDSTRLREAVDWEPRVSMEETLQRLLSSWRERITAS